MTKIDTTPKLFSREDAESVAAAYQAGDPDWTYRAVLLVEKRASILGIEHFAVEILEAPDGEHIAFVPVDPA